MFFAGCKARAPEGEDCRTRILAAAIGSFSETGFEGTSLRQIAQRAGVMHQLVVYHFKTKSDLWIAAMDALFDEAAQVRAMGETSTEGDAASRLRQWVRDFVRLSTRYPEIHRIMTLEGQADTTRLHWLVENYVTPFFTHSTALIRAAQELGTVRPGNPGELHYGMIGVVTIRLVLAREYRMVSGIDPFSSEEIRNVEKEAWGFLSR